MHEEQSTYHRLDLRPEQIVTPQGKVVTTKDISEKGPKRFFFEFDLYTTKYFGVSNDDIEKYLFGDIDKKGSAAIAAMTSDNWMAEIHPHILNYYEYLDAQRLRTPKGLTWLTGLLNPGSYNELLFNMQKIRRMHCTMWAEASMEIVSAHNSDVKFIVSDNPITFYNQAFYPANKQCEFPNDPGIHLKGTRTIFPLDLNHCAVITNLEYAKSPGKLKAPKPRTNPRFFDNTLINYDNIIRERQFATEQVVKVNHIIKSRAHRYIAAAEPEWLFPERYLTKDNWSSLDRLFVSGSTKLYGTGGQIFLGGKNGELIATQDEFGRKPKNKEEWEQKEKDLAAMKKHLDALLKKEKSRT